MIAYERKAAARAATDAERREKEKEERVRERLTSLEAEWDILCGTETAPACVCRPLPSDPPYRRVAPPITAPFHSKVSIFTAPYLDNYWVRNENTSDLDMGRRPKLKSEVFFMRTQ